uniref:Uncharacterized protein n=1 Tax=Arundo donax TaxID=35708 RepID=A0A0A8XZV8_ARUDO
MFHFKSISSPQTATKFSPNHNKRSQIVSSTYHVYSLKATQCPDQELKLTGGRGR